MDLSRSEPPNPPPAAAAAAATDAGIVPAASAASAPFADAFRLLQAGLRPRELTGAADLVAHYGLREQYDRFCGRPLPASVAEAGQLRRVA
eukprot:SM009858S25257  [mRNA]  locus=s9858:48:548:+ [translate_table: standard]